MDRFIVGTGRCGSTLLSQMLAEHPAVLSLFELFNGIDAARRFAPEPIGGPEFAALIGAEQPFVTAVLRRGYAVPEIVYPFDAGGRYRRDEALPWILVSLLPRLTRDPDALFDALTDFARRLPPRPAAEQYRALFEWLGARLGRLLWIERSGSSVEYLGALALAFPEARFLHLHRDGPETALSMREHHAYRLPICFLYDAPVASGRRVTELGGIDLSAPPRPDDAISQILASRPPPALFGRYWSDQIERGLAARPRIAAERYAELRFEDLLAAPENELARIERFFALPPTPGWRERAAARVRGAPARRAPELSPAERADLDAACRPGMRRLGRARSEA
jgi:hypothetical protein